MQGDCEGGGAARPAPAAVVALRSAAHCSGHDGWGEVHEQAAAAARSSFPSGNRHAAHRSRQSLPLLAPAETRVRRHERRRGGQEREERLLLLQERPPRSWASVAAAGGRGEGRSSQYGVRHCPHLEPQHCCKRRLTARDEGGMQETKHGLGPCDGLRAGCAEGEAAARCSLCLCWGRWRRLRIWLGCHP